LRIRDSIKARASSGAQSCANFRGTIRLRTRVSLRVMATVMVRGRVNVEIRARFVIV
jgi:hypothetical protein